MSPRQFFPLVNYPLLLIPIILFASTFLSDHVAFSFYCTDSYCVEQTASYNSPCQPVSNCTKIGYRKFLDPDKCNCCEYCFDYLEKNDKCDTYTSTKPTEMCGPHLTCEFAEGAGNTERATCQPIIGATQNRDFCMARRYEYEHVKRGVAQVNPECDANGFYAPRQCLPGSVCYCSSLNGDKLFGFLAKPQEYQDCACARDVSRLQEFGFKGRFPHCLPNGDYDELQCVVRTCFCRSHPDEKFAMHRLNESKCFDPNIHIFEPETPHYYMRDCELARARIEIEIAEAEMEGRKLIVADMPQCDPDGNYAPVQSKINKLYCANSTDGLPIEDYEATKFSPAAEIMNCNCARVRELLFESASKPRCCSNGNYRPWQCVGRKCFCVDTIGRQIPEWGEVKDDPTGLQCYPDQTDPTDPDGNEPECPYDEMLKNNN